MASGLVALKDIPSVSTLYRSKELKPSSKDDLPPPNQESNDKVCTVQYDITKLEVDAIVNAANTSLLGGGGVDGAIHRAAGHGLLEECRTLRGCKTGSSKITDAYNLPSKKVIHTVGPVYDSDEESEPLLRGCYRTSLQLAVENDCKSIAFSAISTGVYGYPSTSAAYVAIDETHKFLTKPEGQKLDKIIFCNFLDKDVNAYARILPLVFPPTQDDLNPSGEYSQENPISGDKLPTSPQTRPRAISESQMTESISHSHDSISDAPTAANLEESSFQSTSSTQKKRKAEDNRDGEPMDGISSDSKTAHQRSSTRETAINGASGEHRRSESRGKAADEMIDRAGTDTLCNRKTTHGAAGRRGMSMSDLSEDEALNILGYINVNGTVMTIDEFEKEISIGQTTKMTNGATATVNATKKEISFIKNEEDVDEVVIFMPKSDLPAAPPATDPTRNLSTAETLHYYLESNAGVVPRRNSVGESVPTGSRARCSHHFKKIADGEASGMWPAGKYKCQSCSMIISP